MIARQHEGGKAPRRRSSPRRSAPSEPDRAVATRPEPAEGQQTDDLRTAATDLTARVARERVMAERERWHHHFKRAERLAGTGSWRLNLATATMEWTQHAFSIFGLPTQSEDPSLERALDFYPVRDRELLMQAIDRAIGTGESYDVETDIVTATGERRRIRNIGEVEFVDGEPACLVGVCQDVTAHHEIEQALERTAMIDELTGIANRAALNQFLAQHVEKGRRDNALALLLIDLDNFKLVNDTYGHPAGDDVLQKMAAKLKLQAETLGFAARMGGDEFVLAITDAPALHRLRDILATLLADLRLDVPGEAGTIVVGATVGACFLEDSIRTRGEIMRRADLALYNAKALGKGRAMVSGDLRPILPTAGSATGQ